MKSFLVAAITVIMSGCFILFPTTLRKSVISEANCESTQLRLLANLQASQNSSGFRWTDFTLEIKRANNWEPLSRSYQQPNTARIDLDPFPYQLLSHDELLEKRFRGELVDFEAVANSYRPWFFIDPNSYSPTEYSQIERCFVGAFANTMPLSGTRTGYPHGETSVQLGGIAYVEERKLTRRFVCKNSEINRSHEIFVNFDGEVSERNYDVRYGPNGKNSKIGRFIGRLDQKGKTVTTEHWFFKNRNSDVDAEWINDNQLLFTQCFTADGLPFLAAYRAQRIVHFVDHSNIVRTEITPYYKEKRSL